MSARKNHLMAKIQIFKVVVEVKKNSQNHKIKNRPPYPLFSSNCSQRRVSSRLVVDESCNGNPDDKRSPLLRGPEDNERMGQFTAAWSWFGLSVSKTRPITLLLGQPGCCSGLKPIIAVSGPIVVYRASSNIQKESTGADIQCQCLT